MYTYVVNVLDECKTDQNVPNYVPSLLYEDAVFLPIRCNTQDFLSGPTQTNREPLDIQSLSFFANLIILLLCKIYGGCRLFLGGRSLCYLFLKLKILYAEYVQVFTLDSILFIK